MAATDLNEHQQPGLDDPFTSGSTPAQSDTVELTNVTRGIWVGGAGNVKVVLQSDSSPVTFTAVPAGTLLRVRAKQIYSTGTTATNLVALY